MRRDHAEALIETAELAYSAAVYRYYTASTLDGFIADDNDNLDWLLTQPHHEDGILNYSDFIADVGVLAMGATTYQWILDHQSASGEPWPYTQPTFVFTHRDLTPLNESIHLVTGPPSSHRDRLTAAASGKDVWIVGGGDLAAQFADAAMLDEIIVSYAPVLLGSGRPLFTGALDLELCESSANGALLCARYRVRGPR